MRAAAFVFKIKKKSKFYDKQTKEQNQHISSGDYIYRQGNTASKENP